jgi:hypothetical protein
MLADGTSARLDTDCHRCWDFFVTIPRETASCGQAANRKAVDLSDALHPNKAGRGDTLAL